MTIKTLQIFMAFGIIFFILTAGCISYDQETQIHEVVTAKEILCNQGSGIPQQPVSENVFSTDTGVIYACANVTSTPFESSLYVRWHGFYGDNKVIEESRTIECSAEGCWQCFNISKPKDGWRAGNYDVNFQINDDVFSHSEFEIKSEIEQEIYKEIEDEDDNEINQQIYPEPNKTENRVCISGECFYVELALNKSQWAQGLMLRQHLERDEGMLFIFEKEGIYPFWMKNTLIPLDIIWIGSDNEVVFISKNTPPCRSDPCPNITPAKEALYVLELNGGISDEIGLQVGDEIFIDLENKREQF